MKTNFETQDCSRCHGSGHYSWCQTYGDKCFKCAGSGVTLTKRGAAARAFYESLCMVPASQIKVGDRIAASGITRGCAIFNYVGTVIEIQSREVTRTTTRTKRDDGSIYASYDTVYLNNDGSSVSTSGGGYFDNKGEVGTVIENFTEYTFKTESKYGRSSQSGKDAIRIYPANSAELIAKALEYQATLTKTGTVRKAKVSA